MAIRVAFACALAFLAGAVAVHAGHGDSSEGCDYAAVAMALIRAHQVHDAATVEALYHRNAIRYDNGKLSPLSHGKPFSALQLQCVWKRVEMRTELRGATTDSGRHTVIMALRLHVNTEDPIDLLHSLEFDRRTCQVSVERVFYSTEHAAFHELIDKTKDDCWGPEVQVGGPTDNIIRLRDCWGHFDAGRATDLLNCYSNGAVFTLNGVSVPAPSRTDLQTLFSKVNFNINSLSVVQDRTTGVVSSSVTGYYVLIDDNPANNDAQTYPFSIAQKDVVRNGQVVSSSAVYDENQFEEAYFYAGLLPPTGGVPETVAWEQRGPRDAIKDVVKYYGQPAVFSNEKGQAGFARWVANPASSFGCASSVVLRDEAVQYTPSLPSDPPAHTEFVYTTVPVEIPNSKFFLLQRITQSLVYDYMTRSLTARGDSLGTNMVQLWMGLKFATNGFDFRTLQANYGKGYDLVVHVDANRNRRLNPDGTVAYTQLFQDMAKQICEMRTVLNAQATAGAA